MPEAEAARSLPTAEGFFELGDSQEALRVLDSMSAPARQTSRALCLRALLLMSLGRWAEAEAVALAALTASAASPLQWYTLAVAQAQQHKLAEARQSLSSAFDLDADLREIARRDAALAEVW